MISVCIATYNGERYIKQQLDSILKQIGSEDEVVISDDGSTDKTLQIVLSYNDPRIKVYHHDSSTVKTTFLLDKPTHNFENALNMSTGDIIFLADQDDEWMPDKVKIMTEALENADFAVHDCIVMDSVLKDTIQPSFFSYIDICKGVWHNFYRQRYMGCCMAFRRELLYTALPFPRTKVGHDQWLGIVANMKYKVNLVRKVLIKYRKHENSKTTSGTKSNHSLWFKINYRLTLFVCIMKLYARVCFMDSSEKSIPHSLHRS